MPVPVVTRSSLRYFYYPYDHEASSNYYMDSYLVDAINYLSIQESGFEEFINYIDYASYCRFFTEPVSLLVEELFEHAHLGVQSSFSLDKPYTLVNCYCENYWYGLLISHPFRRFREFHPIMLDPPAFGCVVIRQNNLLDDYHPTVCSQFMSIFVAFLQQVWVKAGFGASQFVLNSSLFPMYVPSLYTAPSLHFDGLYFVENVSEFVGDLPWYYERSGLSQPLFQAHTLSPDGLSSYWNDQVELWSIDNKLVIHGDSLFL